jgi:putative tributyrin esterase
MRISPRKSFSDLRRASRLSMIAACFAALAWAIPAIHAAGRAPQAASTATTLKCEAITSTILGRSVNTCVALPSDYDTATGTRYPVLYFLHGLFENERSWSERGGQQILDGLLSEGEVGKFIVVMPDGGKSFYVNSKDGQERWEDFFIQELVPAVDKKYRTIPEVNLRGISGVSMGGYGALHIAMLHPDVFSSVSAQSAALLPKFPNPLPTEGRWGRYARLLQGPFGAPLSEAYWEQNSPLTLAEHPENFKGLKLYFDCGDEDRYGFEEGAQLLDKTLTANGFPHEFHLRSGNHGWSYLGQYMKYALLFHWHIWAPQMAKGAKP